VSRVLERGAREEEIGDSGVRWRFAVAAEGREGEERPVSELVKDEVE
jgi:hypothetical protein